MVEQFPNRIRGWQPLSPHPTDLRLECPDLGVSHLSLAKHMSSTRVPDQKCPEAAREGDPRPQRPSFIRAAKAMRIIAAHTSSPTDRTSDENAIRILLRRSSCHRTFQNRHADCGQTTGWQCESALPRERNLPVRLRLGKDFPMDPDRQVLNILSSPCRRKPLRDSRHLRSSVVSVPTVIPLRQSRDKSRSSAWRQFFVVSSPP